jgi:hypothetical protein
MAISGQERHPAFEVFKDMEHKFYYGTISREEYEDFCVDWAIEQGFSKPKILPTRPIEPHNIRDDKVAREKYKERLTAWKLACNSIRMDNYGRYVFEQFCRAHRKAREQGKVRPDYCEFGDRFTFQDYLRSIRDNTIEQG